MPGANRPVSLSRMSKIARPGRVQPAIEAVGGLARLANMVGVRPSTICGWRNRDQVPSDRVAVVSQLTGLPYHLLNPHFPPPPKEPHDGP